MVAPGVLTTVAEAEEQVAEVQFDYDGVAQEAPEGPWRAFRTRIQNVFWNYMALGAQTGLYGGGDYGDP